MAKTEQKTRTCPYCGSKVELNKSKKVAVAKTAREASAILREIKSARRQQ
ncbi:MAG: DUF1922 domain-containing protein [Candidatus Bathyarchaeota archaeon]|nr:DUF1922 domain-containing protein [Candidatus Bathyarchaeota archaeon]